ncbi:hypothetical protein [Parvularcula oceani]|uniref:hypothetical protein n=1 Tax=Parvularcula oceani TaxID=1247963 RepID=UPI0012DC47C2|nr:hypothetical protein [Parvularcula oceani]
MLDVVIVILIWIFATAVGFVRYFVELRNEQKSRKYIVDYKNRFVAWVNSRGRDQDAYAKLVQDTEKATLQVGLWGVLDRRIPLQGVRFRNFQILPNLIPAINREFHRPYGSMTIDQDIRAVDECLLRAIGSKNELIADLKTNMWNPFRLAIHGVRCILVLPLLLLSEIGLFPLSIYFIILDSGIFKIFSSIVILISLFSGVMTIMIGWEEFFSITSRFIHL